MAVAAAWADDAEAFATALTFIAPLLVKLIPTGSTFCQAPSAKAEAFAEVAPLAVALAATLSVPLLTIEAEPEAALTNWPMPIATAVAVAALPAVVAVVPVPVTRRPFATALADTLTVPLLLMKATPVEPNTF